ncbi:Arm DNA-binding domain-containing protein [Pseudomonas asuensis]|uniref:Arm DNA-binding domain-containing protein n=1 Tax=Pseudomonas asuensis TaxID=1825787 RepID=UPI001E3F82FB|nr:Arm DNA-binding domain-containing protein [Pseudomonas asuensis]
MLGLGTYHAVTLAKACERHEDARKLFASDIQASRENNSSSTNSYLGDAGV